MKRTGLIFATLLLLAGLSYAQTGGTVGIQTVNVTLTKATAPGVLTYTPPGQSATSILNNIGQSSHWLTYCTGGTVNQISIRLEASFDNTNWFPISQTGTFAGCQVLEAGGYFPLVRANLLVLSGTSPTVSAWYAASDAPILGSGSSVNTRYTSPVGSAFEVASKTTGASFFANLASTNPAANTVVMNVFNPGTLDRTLFFHRARISCSAACKVGIFITDTQGTCSTATAGNPGFPTATGIFSGTSEAAVGINCTVNPLFSIAGPITLNVAAGGYEEINLDGYYETADGIAVENLTALTGELDVTLEWYEQ